MNNTIRCIVAICFMGCAMNTLSILNNNNTATISKEKIALMSQLYAELEQATQKGDTERVNFLRKNISALVDTMSENLHKKKKNSLKQMIISAGIVLPIVIIAWKMAFMILNNQLKKDAKTVRDDFAQVASVVRDDTKTLAQTLDNRMTHVAQAAHNDVTAIVQTAHQEMRQVATEVRDFGQTVYGDIKSVVRTIKWGALGTLGLSALGALYYVAPGLFI